MRSHCHDLGNDGFVRPFNTEHFCELLKVMRSCFTNGENSVAQPAHAESGELLIEELNAQLARQKRNVLNDR